MVDERSILQGLMQRGIPAHIAQGFVMNMRDESGLNPGINEIAPLVPGSRGGFGLYQLTGPRRTAYEQFAGSRGVDPANVDAQLDFLVSELQGPESRAAQSIFATQDVPSAAAAIARDFLRPAPENLQKRVAQYTGGTAMQPQGLLGTVSTQGQEPEQLPFFQRPETANLLDTLAIGFSGMTLNPNQALIQSAQERIKGRRESAQTAQQRNRTLEYLRTLGTPQAMEAIRYAEATGDVAGALKMAQGGGGQYRQITGPDAAAMGLDPNKVYNLGPEGKVSGIGGGDTILQMGGESSEFRKASDKALAAQIGEISTEGLSAQRSLGLVNELDRVLQQAPQGFGGALVGMAGNLGLQLGEEAGAVQAAQAIINRLVPQQRQPGSGTMSDADLELFKQSLPRIINQPEGNRRIIDTLKAIAQYDIERGNIARRSQIGEITPFEALQQIQSLQNPLDWVRSMSTEGVTDQDRNEAMRILLGE